MQGEINSLTFSVQDQSLVGRDFNKISIIKAFRDYAKYLEFDSSKLYQRLDDIRSDIRRLQAEADEINKTFDSHYDSGTGTVDAVDQICAMYCITERARMFLQNTPSGLKEQKDAVELMMAIGEIKGRPQPVEQSWDYDNSRF